VRPPRPFGGRLLYVGRLVKEKGVHRLLEGAARARARDARITMTLVAGEGPPAYRALVERRIRELRLADVVDWRGPVARAELPALFAEHDALLFASRGAEPAPLVSMEAMAAQLPVVFPAPRSPSPIYEDGVTCVTYGRTDGKSIAGAIARLAGDPALAVAVARGGSARIRNAFTREQASRQYAALLTATIAAARER
jgi:glycosyltransferase involved in cell wall biosynthesis